MQVLIVECVRELGDLWRRHLERQGIDAHLAISQAEAVRFLRTHEVSVIVLDLVIDGGSAFAIADYASYRQPDAKVLFVTNTSFFSDGSIFRHIPNACAFIRSDTAVGDIAAMVDHFGTH